MKRTMSPAEVKASIVRGLHHHSLKLWDYLEADGGHLRISQNQNPGGEIVDRRGALYIREKSQEMSKEVITCQTSPFFSTELWYY